MDASEHTILLIEDHFELSTTISELLDLKGYNNSVAQDGKSGLDKILTNKPDLIICDINLPLMDGFEILTRLKQEKDDSYNPKFIYLSAKTMQSEIDKGLALGADRYLLKPFQTMELLDTIEQLLG